MLQTGSTTVKSTHSSLDEPIKQSSNGTLFITTFSDVVSLIGESMYSTGVQLTHDVNAIPIVMIKINTNKCNILHLSQVK